MKIRITLFMLATLTSAVANPAPEPASDTTTHQDPSSIADRLFKPLTRSWTKPKTETRSGKIIRSSTRSFLGDGTRSLYEVELETQQHEVEAEASVSLPIRFEINEAEVLSDEASRQQLKDLIRAMNQLPPGVRLLIEGHTCPKGKPDYNDRLSAARAAFVRQSLVDAGVSQDRLEYLGCGPAEASRRGLTPASRESELALYRKVMVHKLAN